MGIPHLKINGVTDMFKCWQCWCRIHPHRTVMVIITTTTTIVTTTVDPSKTSILVQQKALWHAGRE